MGVEPQHPNSLHTEYVTGHSIRKLVLTAAGKLSSSS